MGLQQRYRVEVHTKGKPHQNGYIERFNRSKREAVLNAFAFHNLRQAQVLVHAWMWIYNNERSHTSLKYHTPTSFFLKCGKLQQTQHQS
jgi:putative transposase